MERRAFLHATAVTAAASLIPASLKAAPEPAPARTIQDVITLLIGGPGRQPMPATVDTVKCGDPTQPVTGIVTAFMANVGVIREAIAARANFIVSHEPIFYNHRDETDWLADDPVYQYKRKLLDEHGLVVLRNHDYLHARRPDPVLMATAERLGWSANLDAEHPLIATFEPRSFQSLVDDVKTRLGPANVRFIGDPAMSCRRVGLMVGAPGGRAQISFMGKSNVDVLLTGEIAEWEAAEYVRDSNAAGRPKGLIVGGHSATECLGMQWLAGWLQGQLPGLPVKYVEARAPFGYA